MASSYDRNLEAPSQEVLDNTLIISARGGYSIDAHKDLGYQVVPPYCDKTLAGRVAREAWIRTPLPDSFWYTPIAQDPKCIIVHDPLITRHYLRWLQTRFPKAKINYLYWNLVGKARHLLPEELPEGIIGWTYDERDAKEHNIELLDTLGFPTLYIGDKRSPDFDLIFVGADKGRAEHLLNLQKEIESLGLTTDFRIMPDGRFSKKKKYYSERMPYKDVIDLVCRSRAVLNICNPQQLGATLRDYEATFNGVKLVTNNTNAKNFPFYNPNNIFILTERPLEDLPLFLQTPFTAVDDSVLKLCTLNAHINQIFKDNRNE